MTWALQRQFFYIAVLVLFFSIFGFLIYNSLSEEEPTCTDGLKNGIETGVDCGGTCAIACTATADNIAVLWSRSFKVVPGRYNAVAYLENHNKNLAIKKIKYSFRFADQNNIYLGRREGVAYIPPGRKFAIFERGIELNTSVPVYTTFSFTEAPIWVTVDEEKINQLQLLISEINLIDEDTTPHLSTTIKNNSLFSIPQINIVVVLFDDKHNAISASSTYIDELKGEETKVLDFTWPEPFSTKVVTKEILPVYNIFGVKLK
jgi:hypothetical protein